MKKIILLAAIASTSFSTAAFAENADCTNEPKDKWQTEDAMKAKGQELGFDVRRVKTEGSCYEIYGIKDGAKVEVLFNPVTLEELGADAN